MKKIHLTSAAPVMAGLLAFTTPAHATQMIETPYSIIWLLAKPVAMVVFFFSIHGICSSKKRVIGAAVVSAFLSTAVFVAPEVAPSLVREFSAAVAEMLP